MEGVTVYTSDPSPMQDCAYIYPPFTAQMMIPLVSNYDYWDARRIWYQANIALLIITVALLSYHFRHTNYVRIIWMLPLLFTPTIQNFWVGQVAVLLFFLISGAWLARKRGWGDISGGLLAIATWIKIFPIFLLIYAIWRRDWQVVRGGLLVGFSILFLQMVISPPQYLWDYFTIQLSALLLQGQEFLFSYNASLLGQSLRFFVDNDYNTPLINAPQYVDLSRRIMLLILFSVSGFALYRSYRNTAEYMRDHYDLEYALVLLVAMWFGPTLWISGMTPLILVYILFMVNEVSRVRLFLVSISIALLTIYLPMLYGRSADADWAWWIHSVGFFGVLILWLLLVWQVANSSQPDENVVTQA